MGSSTRHGKLPLAAIAVFALLAILASTALALQTHPSGDDLEAVPGGAFSYRGLAVDQSGGDVYAVDQFDPNTFAHGFIHRFGPDGSYDEAFDTATATFSEGLNQPQDVAVDNSSTSSDGTIYVADTANNRVAAIDESGAPVAGFGTAGLINGTEDSPGDPDTVPTGAFSSPCGVAVDNSNGNLFVADQGNNRIWIFDSSGAFLGKIADSALNGPCGLAFTSTGDLYVRNANDGKVLRFARQSATAYEFGSVFYAPGDNGTPADPSDDFPPATDVAVDTADDHVYIDKGNRITEYDSSASVISNSGQGEIGDSSAGLAVETGGGALYASAGNRIATFGALSTLADVSTGDPTNVSNTAVTVTGTLDPLGIETTECFFEWGNNSTLGNTTPCIEGDAFSAPAQVSMEKTRGELALPFFFFYRLVVANANGTARGAIKQAGLLSEAPGSFVTNVTTTLVTLHAELDPRGAASSYHFEYVDDAAFNASGFDSALKAPVPDATAPASNSRISVEQALSGLSPNTRYHYRVVADLGGTPYLSNERSFKTDPIAPSIPAAQFPGQGFLPDNRAWEMITPPEKNGSTANAWGNKTIVAPDGNRVAYASPGVFGDAQGTGGVGNAQYVATRGAGGWTRTRSPRRPPPVTTRQSPLSPSPISALT